MVGGRTVTLVGLAFTPGQMEENTREITKMIKNMVMELIPMPLGTSTKDNGLMANSTVKESTLPNQVKQETAFGRTEVGQGG